MKEAIDRGGSLKKEADIITIHLRTIASVYEIVH